MTRIVISESEDLPNYNQKRDVNLWKFQLFLVLVTVLFSLGQKFDKEIHFVTPFAAILVGFSKKTTCCLDRHFFR